MFLNDVFLCICREYIKTRGVKQAIENVQRTWHSEPRQEIEVNLETGEIWVTFEFEPREYISPERLLLIGDPCSNAALIEKVYGKYRYDPVRYGATEHIMEADRFYMLRWRWWYGRLKASNPRVDGTC